MTEMKFIAPDGKTINVSVWDSVKKPKGGVYIAHGMSEYSARYGRFAEKLNKAGYIVLAADERGHGKTATVKGQVCGDSFLDTVEDTRALIEYMEKTYQVEVFLFGHSYGSAVAQSYIQKYSGKVKGVILSGSAYFKSAATMSGMLVAKIGKAFLGADHPAKLVAKLSFGMYDKPFRGEGKNAWLSRDISEVKKYNDSEDCGYVMSYGFYNSFFSAIAKMYGKEAVGIRKDLPILIAGGGEDPVSTSASFAKKLAEWYKKKGLKAELKIYEGARHEILNETNRDEVTEDLVDFIDFCYEDVK